MGVPIVVGVQLTSVGLDAVLSVEEIGMMKEIGMMNVVMLANKRMKAVGAHKFITS